MPGVRLTPAVVIALEIGDVTRFSHRGKLTGYAGSRSVAMRDVQGEPTLGSTNAPAAGEPATALGFNATGVAWRVARSLQRIIVCGVAQVLWAVFRRVTDQRGAVSSS
jgi:hypothetical protein